jgi:hypothetical protein
VIPNGGWWQSKFVYKDPSFFGYFEKNANESWNVEGNRQLRVHHTEYPTFSV